MAAQRRKITYLPPGFGSLSDGLPPSPPGTIFVKGPSGGRGMAPEAGSELVFGRNEEVVQVCIGGTDTAVSRQHGVISHTGSRWMLQNIGQRPIRLPGGRNVLRGGHAEVPPGFAPLIIMSSAQEHVLEVRIAAPPGIPAAGDPYVAETCNPDVRPFESDLEKLVLVSLARRYLSNDPHAQPMGWGQVAEELAQLRPDEKWDWRRASKIVRRTRERLSEKPYYVPGLMEHEIAQPIGNTLNHNLITDLLISGTLFPEDLELLEPPGGV